MLTGRRNSMYNRPVWENPLDAIILETSIDENWVIHSTKVGFLLCARFLDEREPSVVGAQTARREGKIY